MKLGLIISNDWELFGDGSGDYFKIQHRPVEALLDVVEAHGGKLTIMAEVGQQWAHEKIAKHKDWAREVVASWKAILKDAVKREHDVQLHLHPQWLAAKYKNNNWQLDFNHWVVSSLSPSEMEAALKKGKLYLETLLRPIDPSYECIAFRAGAYCIQPSKVPIQKLLEAGIICDMSVTKGKYKPPFYDYRDAHSNIFPWFACPHDIRYEGASADGLLEIPIHSQEVLHSPILQKLCLRLSHLLSFNVLISKRDKKWLTDRIRVTSYRYPLNKRPASVQSRKKSLKWLISKALTKASIQLNYDYLPPKVFVKFLENIRQSNQGLIGADLIVPVVATGHVKDMHNCDNIDGILREINVRLYGEVIYWNLSDAVEYWINRSGDIL